MESGSKLEETFYNVSVTAEQLWQRVGDFLVLARNRRKWNPSDVERHGGPNYKTVQAIEQGRIGNLRNLTRHAEALGLSIVDVLRTVLEQNSTPLSSEAVTVVRHFYRTTVKGRQALLTTAEALPDAAEGEQPGGHRSPPVPPARGNRKP
jgi:hypothetical protein